MLSILIPTYNYSVRELISSLDMAVKDIGFDYEILCLEDGSTLHLDDNKAVCNATNNSTHFISNKNEGSIVTRSALAQKAKYRWLLFLDADVKLTDNGLITKYSNYFNNKYDAIYGGCSYDTTKPDTDYVLRWKYGSCYEQIDAENRNTNPYKYLVSANFLIKKAVFLKASSKIKNRGYGNDVVFASILKSNTILVRHIDNFVFHKGLDTNIEFLNKSKKAIDTLYLAQHKKLTTDSSLLKLFKKLKAIGLTKIIALLFSISKKSITNNLLSRRPNIKLFQFYKLGYLCALSHKKK